LKELVPAIAHERLHRPDDGAADPQSHDRLLMIANDHPRTRSENRPSATIACLAIDMAR